MAKVLSPIERIMAAATAERLALARARADRALLLLRQAGFSAYVAGSLARGDFGPGSDVDFVIDAVDADYERAFALIDEAMDGFPFDAIPLPAIPQEMRGHLLT
jgi:predicted nucleotidyltransferase